MAGITVAGPTQSLPQQVTPLLVQIRGLWTDPWHTRPDIEPVRASIGCSEDRAGTAEFRRHYGNVKGVFSADFLDTRPLRIDQFWIRICTVEPGYLEPLWIGQIFNESRQVYSCSTQAGVQTFIAHDPMTILDKTAISRSVWKEGADAPITVDWVADFNSLDRANIITGNRTAEKTDPYTGSYVFGGTYAWKRYSAIEYILRQFVQAEDGPEWDMVTGGYIGALAAEDVFAMREGESAGAIIRRMIPPELGLGYRVTYDDSPTEHFTLRVFPLSSRRITFGSASLPANSKLHNYQPYLDKTITSATVVRVSEQEHRTLRVVGSRAVCCFSLWSKNAPQFSAQPADGSLIPKWSDTLETEYIAGTGGAADPEDHDKARKDEKYESVYRQYGAPADWDHQSGGASPKVYSNGQVASTPGDYTNQSRSTLGWIPLRAGWDYSTATPTNNNAADYPGDLLRPAVWIYDDELERYVLAEDLGYSVHTSRLDWGVRIGATPNHLLADGHWIEAELATTDTEPAHDYDRMIATIACETDDRLALEHTNYSCDPGTVKEVHVPSAQLWWLAPFTFLGVDKSGVYVTSPGTGVEIRNDRLKLEQMMCGLIARYGKPRFRMEVQVKGTSQMYYMLGDLLRIEEYAGDNNTAAAPITSIEWTFGRERSTTIRAGFAT